MDVMVPVPGGTVSASVHGRGDTAVVLAPGAGGNRRTPLLLSVAEAVSGSGRCAVLYNFPYTEVRRRIPDRADVLEGTVRAVAAHARDELGARRLVLGGKSMGGRISSQAVAHGVAADALVFLGYPLHPPGKTEQLRTPHFADVHVPLLFVQGTRDAFARGDLLETFVRSLGSRARLHRIEGGDHSFVVPRQAGNRPDVAAQIGQSLLAWLAEQGL
jgi:predicted alpha/beta-hydrolase family hydrolase